MAVKTIIQETPPSVINKQRVDFDKSEFEALFVQKGYQALFERAHMCPCVGEGNEHPLSDCKNCGGTGFVFSRPIETRVISHSQNIDTKFKEWSEEKIGYASLTVRDPYKLNFMDRFTYIDAEAVYNERVFPKEITDGLGTATYAFTLHPVIKMEVAYLFVNSNTPLTVLEEGVDYTIDDNVMIFSNNSFAGQTISIRYIHRPQYHVIDIPRSTMVTPIKNLDTGADEDVLMPIHAMVRPTHYVLDAKNRQKNRIFDNSYEQ